MTTMKILDADGVEKHIEGVGDGTVGDPFKAMNLLADGSGNPIESADGAINVHMADVHTQVINHPIHQHTSSPSTLAIATVLGDTSVTVGDGTSYAIGNNIVLNGTGVSFARITAVATNVLTLDRPISKVHAIGAGVDIIDIDLKTTAGTLTSPSIFKLEPPTGEIWHVLRILFTMTHTVAGDLAKFGGISALTNGIFIRENKSGVFEDIANWKDNGDIKKDIFDLEFTDKAGGSGTYGTSGRYTFSKLGVAVTLDGTAGDSLEILIQDDITGLSSFEITGQGHVDA